MKSLEKSGMHNPIIVTLTQKTELEMELEGFKDIKDTETYTEEQLNENLQNLKAFMGDLMCSDEVTKLALKKCKLKLEETLMMVTNPESIADLEDEVEREKAEYER